VVKLRPVSKVLLVLIAIAMIAVGLLLPQAHGREHAPALPRGALSGGPIGLAQLHGHPAVIAFFASWCPGCHTEAAALERFARSAGPDRVIGVADNDGRAAAVAFARGYAWSFPLLNDPTGSVAAAWGVAELPTTVIVNAKGEIVARRVGPETVARLASELHAAA
jgi:cytochrome c biogenesis protein CcmG/thiol:disulfide interchange protein DsbE